MGINIENQRGSTDKLLQLKIEPSKFAENRTNIQESISHC